jgi:hypothetical protein
MQGVSSHELALSRDSEPRCRCHLDALGVCEGSPALAFGIVQIEAERQPRTATSLSIVRVSPALTGVDLTTRYFWVDRQFGAH